MTSKISALVAGILFAATLTACNGGNLGLGDLPFFKQQKGVIVDSTPGSGGSVVQAAKPAPTPTPDRIASNATPTPGPIPEATPTPGLCGGTTDGSHPILWADISEPKPGLKLWQYHTACWGIVDGAGTSGRPMKVDNNPTSDSLAERYETRDGTLFVEAGANIDYGHTYEWHYALWMLKGIKGGRADFELVKKTGQEYKDAGTLYDKNNLGPMDRLEWVRIPEKELPGIDPTDVASVNITTATGRAYGAGNLSESAAIRWGADTLQMACVQHEKSYPDYIMYEQELVTGKTAVGHTAAMFARGGSTYDGVTFVSVPTDIFVVGDKGGRWGVAFPGAFLYRNNVMDVQWTTPRYVETLREFVWLDTGLQLNGYFMSHFYSATDEALLASRGSLTSCPL